ncbi:3-deoxy-D-manno-octulosonic acid transferase [Thiohalocapsa marina]|uniref:3-deoxy-D-manno-octulosonic acid transferase n=1 Tax=Thiohalocapsa marina TaxID=424902 RepID=A0A5M8FHK7_9GAMM|nr:lipid IV(A) 3-deoxy-D-manno-octulosonic acid transferase [Thiohalocapsa marina]KAA6184368.1 3-deoxy-D-manno-octulosonic acid transferase [Thiohalocapsa marina]
MRHLYSALLWLLLPGLLLRLLWRSRRAPAYRERWGERLGLFHPPPQPVDVWLHAVSVGEVQAAQPLIRHLLRGGYSVLVTTTTPTGARRLHDLFGDAVQHRYTPFDLGWVMGRFLGAARPRLVLVMETEIWPNMLAACARRGVDVMLINARLSARSARGYARAPRFSAETMQRFACIAVQGPVDAARFRALGVAPARIVVTGSIKFDVQLPASLMDRAEVMRLGWGNRPVWVAASTHEGEEEPLLAAHARVRQAYPNALLVLVPRHPERFDRVAMLVARQGMGLARRSLGELGDERTAVFLGDTMGELPVFLAAADVAFVGGSLIPHGGHNLLEPAAVGVPVLIGPHSFNFAEITRLLLARQAAMQVADADALAQALTRLLGDAAERARIGENGRRAVESNRGALDRLIGLVDARLEEGRSAAAPASTAEDTAGGVAADPGPD